MDEYISYIVMSVLLVAIELIYIKFVTAHTRLHNHKSTSLTGGGIVFVVAVVLHSIIFNNCNAENGCSQIPWLSYPLLTLATIILGTIGLIDDFRPLSVTKRLIVQFFAMSLICFGLNYNPATIWILLFIIIGVGIINAYNFMDGIDGITGLYSLSVLLPLLYINENIRFVDTSLIISLIIATSIFLIFNLLPKIKCYCGDVGSTTMGLLMVFLISRLIILTGQWTWIMLLSVYGIDTVLTIVRRISMREKITQSHKRHAYQLLVNKIGVPQIQVALAYSILQLIIAFFLIEFSNHQLIISFITIVLFSAIYFYIVTKSNNIANNSR